MKLKCCWEASAGLSGPITGQVAEHIAYHQRRRMEIPKGVFQQNTTRQIYSAHLVDL